MNVFLEHAAMMPTATLTYGDKKIELPVVEGSEGELGIDISTLRAKTSAGRLGPAGEIRRPAMRADVSLRTAGVRTT